jgi:hypothetical protein
MRAYVTFVTLAFGTSPSLWLLCKKRNPGCANSQGFEKCGGFRGTLYFIRKMESKKANQEFDFKVRLRMPPELVKWLIGAILMGGSAATAAAHWIK